MSGSTNASDHLPRTLAEVSYPLPLSPPELVGLLNAVFTTFDGFVEELGLEKIKTMGDAYMVAAGMPPDGPITRKPSPVGPRMLEDIGDIGPTANAISLRIGINSGPVVAGVIGNRSSSTTSGVMW